MLWKAVRNGSSVFQREVLQKGSVFHRMVHLLRPVPDEP